VITGEKKIGKFCLIATAVVKFSVYPRDDQNLFIEKALREVTNLET
jgi:hypothetical protein